MIFFYGKTRIPQDEFYLKNQVESAVILLSVALLGFDQFVEM